MRVEALRAQPTIVRLDERVARRFARPRKAKNHNVEMALLRVERHPMGEIGRHIEPAHRFGLTFPYWT